MKQACGALWEVSKCLSERSMSIFAVTQDINSTPKKGSLKERTPRNLRMQLQINQDHNNLTAKCGTNIMHKSTLRQIFQMLHWLLQKLLFLNDLKYWILIYFFFIDIWSFNPENCLFNLSLYANLSGSWLGHCVKKTPSFCLILSI